MKKQTIFIIILAVLITWGFTTYFKNSKIREYEARITKLQKNNDSLVMDNSAILDKLKSDSILMVNSKLVIDSLMLSDSLNTKKLKYISYKYANLKNRYYSGSDVVKDSIFTELINN